MSDESKRLRDDAEEEQLSLNDDRRVKVLSPGALVAKRFFRNRLAIVGLTILVAMFLFSFIGGMIIPYGEDQFFYTDELQMKEYAAATINNDYRYMVADGQDFGVLLQAQMGLLLSELDKEAADTPEDTAAADAPESAEITGSFTSKDVSYDVLREGDGLYSVSSGGTVLALAYKDIISPTVTGQSFSFEFNHKALMTLGEGGGEFTVDGQTYSMDEEGSVTLNGEDVAFVSRIVVQSAVSGTMINREFREKVSEVIETGAESFGIPATDGSQRDFSVTYDPATKSWSIKEATATRVYDSYSFPNKTHLLGTDKNGMDMLTRLMYGGRVSLIIGFIVVLIETVIGVILGGVSGYFGGWVDNLIMRIVDIFYCIPSMPLIIILGSAMDNMRVDPQIRMLYLMLILGFLGWPSIARLVRGQILSLREQEFMTATEACGISVPRRIFRHLIPNVIPQLIVTCTMSLGSVIITESTLSFLGLGVKFPFASWGNIINDVNNIHVLTNYWFIWIPAGVCLMLTVLGFNFVGDGLRDAFDPKMKR